MSFGYRLRARREAMGMSRAELAVAVGVTTSAIGNYETGISSPKEGILLKLFDCLDTDPNYLYQDSFRSASTVMTYYERRLIDIYRSLPLTAKEAVRGFMDALLEAMTLATVEREKDRNPTRVIPLYISPAAAGYLSPVFGSDYEEIEVTGDVPPGAEKAVRIQGDSMEPYIGDGSVAYVNSDPLGPGDVGIFCVDGDMYCKQYYKDPAGTVYLFSLNRERADADLVFTTESGRSCTFFGRVMIKACPLPGR